MTQINEVMSVGVFKDCGINYVKFDVKDSNGLKHVFNFNVDVEPNVAPGTKIKVKYTTKVDLDFAEISKDDSQAVPTAPKKEFPKAVAQQQQQQTPPPQQPKPGPKPGPKKTGNDEPFISFQTG